MDKILILDLRAELKRQVSTRSLELAQLEGMSFTDAESWIQTNTFLLKSVLAKRLVGTNSQDTDVFVIGTIQTTLRQSVARNAAGHPKNATEVADDNSGAQSATRVVISSEKQDGSHTGDPMTA